MRYFKSYRLYTTLVAAAFFFVCFLILPAIVGAIWIKVFTSAAIFSLAAAGSSLVYARLGLVNLAQVSLVGIGGWVVLRLNFAIDLPFEVNMLVSALVTACIGMILALPALCIRGLYLALVTLMAAGAIQIIFTAHQFPNGGAGFWGVAMQSPGDMRRPFLAESDEAFLRYTIAIVVIALYLVALHERTRSGRAWAMIRKSEANALAAGVNVTLYKMWAFALSGFLAGTAGGLLAGALKLLDARSFTAGESMLLFALSVVGGVGHWIGAVITGILFRVVPAVLNDIGLDADLALIVFGVALLHAMMTSPDGIAGHLILLFRKVRGQK